MPNVLKGLTKEKIKQKLVEDLQTLGKTEFEIKISPQAQEIISNYGDKFPWEHFKQWWLRNYAVVNGQQLHHYFAVKDGFEEGIKEEEKG